MDAHTIKMFKCKRCGYETNLKTNLIIHLQSKKECKTTLSNISREILIQEINDLKNKDKPNNFECKICFQGFTCRSTKWRHEVKCINITKLTEKNAKIKILFDKLLTEYKSILFENMKKNFNFDDNEEDRIKECMEYLNNSLLNYNNKVCNKVIKIQTNKEYNKEEFFQILLEIFYKSTHKNLEIGVTDITTDNMHGEIKRWNCWKESIGQLLAYNKDCPKDNLNVYLFGDYKLEYKVRAANVLKECNINIFDCEYNKDKSEIIIRNFFDENVILKYYIKDNDEYIECINSIVIDS